MTRAVRSLMATELVLLALFGTSVAGPATTPPVSESDGPVNSAGPTVSPADPERGIHFALPGAWTATGSIEYAYQWFRCDARGRACQPISGAVTDRYEISSADLGQRLRVDVTATDSSGSRKSSSEPTAVIPARATPPAGDPVIALAGDIACDPDDSQVPSCPQMATSDLVVGRGYSAVLALGDLQYTDGAYADFVRSYDVGWGRVNGITLPSPGNHEYDARGAAGYYTYFGALAGDPDEGWYSVDIGEWHLVSINSNCEAVACDAGSAQVEWLRADLAASDAECTLAYWHHPRFSSGHHGSDETLDALWDVLYEYGADVVANGHDHNYERFAPQDPTGSEDPEYGIRQFIAGTGGANLRKLDRLLGTSEVHDTSTHGVLELTLRPDGYSWEFLPVAGATFTDSGEGSCHGRPAGSPAQPPADGETGGGGIVPAAETDPVRNGRDAADDVAIWVNPDSAGESLIIGTDKRAGGGLAIYDLTGREVAFAGGGAMNNVDLRDGFSLGDREVTLVTASDRDADSLAIYELDPAQPSLVDVAGAPIDPSARVYGTCMYRSSSGALYAFITSGNGVVEQWELTAVGDRVEGRLARTIELESRTEGCAADDELGWLYLSEEATGLWRYPAEPDAVEPAALVDTTGPDGHLVADVEGVAIAAGPEGAGYLIVSSQGDDRFVIYDRRPPNGYVGEFSISGSESVDEVTHTDGIEVTTASLGEAFPGGLFVAQDDDNPEGNQNFKLVRWDEVLEALDVAGS